MHTYIHTCMHACMHTYIHCPRPGQHHSRLPTHPHTPGILLDINEQMIDTATFQCKSTLLQVTNYWDLAVVQVQLQLINHIKKKCW